MFNLNYNFMAQFNDSQILKLLINRINELYAVIPENLSDSPDLNLFYTGYRSSLDSLSEALSFYQSYKFD